MVSLDERITRYLAKCEPAISGSGGSDQTFKVTCTLYNGYALDEAETLRWLRHYSKDCQPPWSEKELRHKVSDAMKAQHDKPRGHLLGASSRQQANAPVPIKIRRAGETDESRTLRTVHSETSPTFGRHSRLFSRTVRTLPGDIRGCAGMGAPAHAPARPIPCARIYPLIPSVPSVEKEKDSPSLKGELSVQELADKYVPLVSVPGCQVGRPPEIEVDDDTWRAIEAAEFAEEPVIQHALFLFGPGCTVVAEGAKK